MARKKQDWKVGDLFLIPLADDKQGCLAQLVGREPSALNSATVVLFDRLIEVGAKKADVPLDRAEIFSQLFVTRDLLDNGRWRIVGSAPPVIDERDRPYEHLRAKGFIGAKIRGSGLVESFVSAFYGLVAWDGLADPGYFDAYLVAPEKKPLQRIFFARK
jgi:hypothetical protein